MLQAIERICRYTKGKNFEDFIADDMMYYAVVKNIEILGEASIYTRKYTDTRMFMCSFSYKFNVSRSKYKGTGAGNTEKNRL